MTPFEVLTIPLDGQQDEKIGRLARGQNPTILRHANNVLHEKAGEARKRRGFERITTSATVLAQTPEAVFVALGVDAIGELVLVGFRDVYGVVSNDNDVDGSALVRRGPSCVGTYERGVLHVSNLGVNT